MLSLLINFRPPVVPPPPPTPLLVRVRIDTLLWMLIFSAFCEALLHSVGSGQPFTVDRELWLTPAGADVVCANADLLFLEIELNLLCRESYLSGDSRGSSVGLSILLFWELNDKSGPSSWFLTMSMFKWHYLTFWDGDMDFASRTLLSNNSLSSLLLIAFANISSDSSITLISFSSWFTFFFWSSNYFFCSS